MIRLLLLLLLAGCATATAETPQPYLAAKGPDWGIVLFKAPCTDEKVTPMIKKEHLSEFQAAEGVFTYMDGSTKVLKGCWYLVSAEQAGAPEAVYLIPFEDHDVITLPESRFHPKEDSKDTTIKS